MNHKFLSAPFALKSISHAGQFTGRASVYGVVDAHNDVVMPGAFRRSLLELGGEIVVLNQHNPADPIGKARLIDRADGLHAEGQLVLDLPSAREMHTRMQHGLINGISIGYEVLDQGWAGDVRQLKEIKLWEISLVTYPANHFARVTDVKQQGQEDDAQEMVRACREHAAWAKRHRQQHMDSVQRFIDNFNMEISK